MSSSVVPLEIAIKILAETVAEVYERGRQIGSLELAVIEAAEAWYQTAGNGAPVNLDEVLLHQAVEALQAAKEVE